HHALLMAHFYLGDFVTAEDHFERGSAFVAAPEFPWMGALAVPLVITFGPGSWNALISGHADAARERVERMRRILEGTHGNPFVTALAQSSAARLHVLLRDFARAEALAGEALTSCEEHGFAEAAIWARTPLGLARAELGRTAEGVALLRQALAGATEMGLRTE